MKEQRKQTVAVSDTPISKPSGNIPEEFIRLVESRFVTKRFPRKRQTSNETRPNGRNNNN